MTQETREILKGPEYKVVTTEKKRKNKDFWKLKKEYSQKLKERGKEEPDMKDFKRAEEVAFGEVVQAPPKISVVPKQKSPESLVRQRVIEAYRDLKKQREVISQARRAANKK